MTIASRASFTPMLLVDKRTLQARFPDLQLAGIDLVDHVRCWRLANGETGDIVWIEQGRYLVRRVRRHADLRKRTQHVPLALQDRGFTVDETLTIDAIVDVPVSPALLQEPSPKR